MNEPIRSCKSCGDGFQVTDEQIARVLKAPMFQSAEYCVTDEEYEARLAACASCEKLMDGATCTMCGCYVQVIAKLKARSCPLPGDNRWR